MPSGHRPHVRLQGLWKCTGCACGGAGEPRSPFSFASRKALWCHAHKFLSVWPSTTETDATSGAVRSHTVCDAAAWGHSKTPTRTCMLQEYTQGDFTQQQMQREIAIMKTLLHENILRLYEVCGSDCCADNQMLCEVVRLWSKLGPCHMALKYPFQPKTHVDASDVEMQR